MSLFENQPSCCRKPLQKKQLITEFYEIKDLAYKEKIEYVLFADPTEFYIKHQNFIDPFVRNNKLSVWEHYPSLPNKTCACGCGEILTGKQRKWFNNHNNMVFSIMNIVNGSTSAASFYLKWYYGDMCQHCNENEWTDVDHIIPVKHGGGGCWLSNYQLLCNSCHKIKTKKDFRWGEFKVKNQSQTTLPL